jgi:hypothetical protein
MCGGLYFGGCYFGQPIPRRPDVPGVDSREPTFANVFPITISEVP